MSNWKNFDQPNLGWLYNKRIYAEQSVVSSINTDNDTLNSKYNLNEFYEDLISFKCDKLSIDNEVFDTIPGYRSFYGQVSYPGLLIGTGYVHGIKNDQDYKLGMSFDHTTGLPVIPGSSIKGIIRAFFEADIEFDTDRGSQKQFTGEKSKEQVIELIKEVSNGDIRLNGEDVKELKDRIFGTSGQYGRAGDDIFFDAVIDNVRSSNAKSVLGLDYITPHKNNSNHELDDYSNPTPIKLMKVMPGNVFKFSFILKEYQLINIDLKEKIFREILFMNGIGAKTSTGYGYLDVNTEKVISRPFENHFPDEIKRYLVKGSSFTGTVTDQKGEYYLITFKVNNYECRCAKKLSEKFTAKVGDCVKVICNNDYTDANPNLKMVLEPVSAIR